MDNQTTYTLTRPYLQLTISLAPVESVQVWGIV